jgi:serine/threonine protein kinase
MGKSFASDFFKTFDKVELPGEIISRYNVVQYLAKDDYCETLLLEEKDGGKLYVLKCFNKADVLHADNEAKILCGLNHKGLPNYQDENLNLENDDKLFVLREYLEGISLDEYMSGNNLTETQAVDIIIELCEIISYLHSQSPPVIHRDIKPSNIIINPQDKSVKLIDFGIARKYSEEAENDTVHFGTHKFAPPEQYGFAQTDCRADIYALGVVIRFMLTGTPNEKITDKVLERIAAKCSAFSPGMRYKNAGQVKNALARYKQQTKQKIIRAAAIFVAACVILCGGFLAGRYTDILSFVPEESEIEIDENAPVNFTEPLIESAVRLMLSKGDDEPITPRELIVISGIYIAGDQVFRSRDEYHDYLSQNYDYMVRGTIQTLDDLKYMRNINEIFITMQPLSDISGIAGNTLLWEINLRNCDIADYSPLLSLPNLSKLDLSANTINDFSQFQHIKSLSELKIGFNRGNMIRSISELGDISHIRDINLDFHHMATLDGIENAMSLVYISLRMTVIRDFSPLNNLPNLRWLEIEPEMKPYLNTLSRDDVEIQVWGE